MLFRLFRVPIHLGQVLPSIRLICTGGYLEMPNKTYFFYLGKILIRIKVLYKFKFLVH